MKKMLSDGARELRNAMGRFATGVCLITVADDGRDAMALTANSFSSLSLDPPLLLWNLQDSSDVFGVYSTARQFAVNVLALEQRDHAARYAIKGDHLLDAAHFQPGEFGTPIIRDALVSFECELEATHAGGDHLIIIGRVVKVHSRDGGQPLLFHAGNYGELC